MIFFRRTKDNSPDPNPGSSSMEGSHSWSSARDSKSRKPQGFESSNLSPSARTISYRIDPCALGRTERPIGNCLQNTTVRKGGFVVLPSVLLQVTEFYWYASFTEYPSAYEFCTKTFSCVWPYRSAIWMARQHHARLRVFVRHGHTERTVRERNSSFCRDGE